VCVIVFIAFRFCVFSSSFILIFPRQLRNVQLLWLASFGEKLCRAQERAKSKTQLQSFRETTKRAEFMTQTRGPTSDPYFIYLFLKSCYLEGTGVHCFQAKAEIQGRKIEFPALNIGYYSRTTIAKILI